MNPIRNLISSWLLLLLSLTAHAQGNSVQTFAITNISLIDVQRVQLLDSITLVIEGDKIKSIGRSERVATENVDQVFDFTGHFVIPGLIDAHVHLFRPKNREEILQSLLYSGVTTVRDMGGDARVYQALIRKINNGALEGPNIYYSANVFGPAFLQDPRTKFAAKGFEPGYAPWMRMITDDTDLEKAMTDAKEAGVTGIKVYSNIAPALLQKISKEAHRQGLKMWSHSSIYPSKPSDAVHAGVDVLSHGVGMIFETQSNMPGSFNDAIKNHVALQDFQHTDESAPAFISLFEEMKFNETIFEPTLSSWNPTIRAQNQKKASAEKVNPTAHHSAAAKKMNPLAMNDWAKRMTRAAFENGVTIAAGTDLSNTMKWVQDEIQFLTECGLPNIEALKAATLNNARAIGIEATHGSVSVGKQADFVILSKNPLDDISHLRSVITVYKNGKPYADH